MASKGETLTGMVLDTKPKGFQMQRQDGNKIWIWYGKGYTGARDVVKGDIIDIEYNPSTFDDGKPTGFVTKLDFLKRGAAPEEPGNGSHEPEAAAPPQGVSAVPPPKTGDRAPVSRAELFLRLVEVAGTQIRGGNPEAVIAYAVDLESRYVRHLREQKL